MAARISKEGRRADYIGDITKGTVSIIPVPPDAELAELTHRVIRNNGFRSGAPPKKRPADFPIPSAGGPSSRTSPRGVHRQRESHL